MIKKVNINKIKSNPNNPRIIKDNKFNKLVKSIKEFPEMLNLRPVVVNKEMIVLGGNMRLKASISAGIKEIPIVIADKLTEEQEKEFIVKDNVGFGEWDWDILANEWNPVKLEEWGLDVWQDNIEDEVDNNYTRKIVAPTYKPNKVKPKTIDLFDSKKYNKLIKNIKESKLEKADKEFLITAALRHIIFDYSKIADYYAHSNKEVQDFMEQSALIIIDFDKAIENGYVKLTKEIANIYGESGIIEK